LIFIGIEDADNREDIQYICRKTANLRIFDDEKGIMNQSILQTGGEVLVVSQFTLFADTRKGNRPSYIRASKPDFAIPDLRKILLIDEPNIATGRENRRIWCRHASFTR